jgi:hypothetical protein
MSGFFLPNHCSFLAMTLLSRQAAEIKRVNAGSFSAITETESTRWAEVVRAADIKAKPDQPDSEFARAQSGLRC